MAGLPKGLLERIYSSRLREKKERVARREAVVSKDDKVEDPTRRVRTIQQPLQAVIRASEAHSKAMQRKGKAVCEDGFEEQKKKRHDASENVDHVVERPPWSF